MGEVAVEVWRGGRVESRHRVRRLRRRRRPAAVVLAMGDVDEPVYPRSAIKPFQALALVESGAADAFGRERGRAGAGLRLARRRAHACGAWSRPGSRGWAWRSGTRLRPAPAFPPASAAALLRAGSGPPRVHNNCSGKQPACWPRPCTRRADPGLRAARPPGAAPRRAALARPAGLTVPEPGIDGCSLPPSAAAAGTGPGRRDARHPGGQPLAVVPR